MATADKLTTVAENVPKVYHAGQLNVVENAECLKGSKTDTAILLDDISPVTHEMGVKVRGKNLFDINGFINLTDNSTYYGINDNGELYVKQSDYRDDTVIPAFVTLEAGTYTLSSTTPITFNFKLINLTNNTVISFNNNITFSIEKVTSLGIKCYQSADTVIGKLQIELGTTATDYTPYVSDLTAVKVSRCGKNLLSNDTVISESVTLVNKKIWSGNLPAPCAFSQDVSRFTATSPNAAAFMLKLADGTEKYLAASGNRFLVRDGTLKEIYFINWARGTGIIKCQLEIGSLETDYEPYKSKTEYIPTTDGTVNGVTSLYPNTTLTTDTDGVLIDCEYYKDIDKTFNELTTSVALSGGDS